MHMGEDACTWERMHALGACTWERMHALGACTWERMHALGASLWPSPLDERCIGLQSGWEANGRSLPPLYL